MRHPAKCCCKFSNSLNGYTKMAFKILSSFYIAAIRHLGFLEIQILTSHTVLRVNMRRHIKFGGDRLNRC